MKAKLSPITSECTICGLSASRATKVLAEAFCVPGHDLLDAIKNLADGKTNLNRYVGTVWLYSYDEQTNTHNLHNLDTQDEIEIYGNKDTINIYYYGGHEIAKKLCELVSNK